LAQVFMVQRVTTGKVFLWTTSPWCCQPRQWPSWGAEISFLSRIWQWREYTSALTAGQLQRHLQNYCRISFGFGIYASTRKTKWT
jgi:hypothetical protein